MIKQGIYPIMMYLHWENPEVRNRQHVLPYHEHFRTQVFGKQEMPSLEWMNGCKH